MTITNIVKRINARMGDDNFRYDELTGALDAAIDQLNQRWQIELPMISELPEMSPALDPVTNQIISDNVVPTEYDALPDDFIRTYVVPFVAGTKYVILGSDGRPELGEAEQGLFSLSAKYPVDRGQTKISKDKAFYGDIQFDSDDRFASDNSNYGNYNTVSTNSKGLLIDPLKVDE